MKRLVNLSFILLALAFALSGCGLRPKPFEESISKPPMEAMSGLLARGERWQSYQAKIRIKAEGPQGKLRINAVLMARLPDRLRLEAFNPFGQTAGLLIFDKEGSSLWVPTEKTVFVAGKPDALIERFLGVPVAARMFGYSLVAGLPPDMIAGLGVEGTGRAGSRAANRSISLEAVDRTDSLKAIIVRDGEQVYRVSYEPPVALTSEDAPRRVTYISSESRMEVDVEQLRAVPDIQDSVFARTVPADVRIVDLDRLER